jgi:hypothetical protein
MNTGKKVTYERWINLFLPDGWSEREEMGYILLEKDGWPGMIQLSFIERDETKNRPVEAAKILLEDTLASRGGQSGRSGRHGHCDRGLYV